MREMGVGGWEMQFDGRLFYAPLYEKGIKETQKKPIETSSWKSQKREEGWDKTQKYYLHDSN